MNGLVILISFSYLLQLLIPGYREFMWISGFEIRAGQYWRLFTPELVHANLLHLGMNLYALHLLGRVVETYFGPTRFFVILLTSLVLSSLTSVLFNSPQIASVGASGMVFGLFGALAIISTKIGIDWRSIFAIVGINFALGFMIGGVDWHGHLGGLVGGTLATLVLNRAK